MGGASTPARPAGRTWAATENAQAGVFLAYAGAKGQAVIDQELYLPKEWTGDPKRCRGAGVPPDRVTFATKIALAQRVAPAEQ